MRKLLLSFVLVTMVSACGSDRGLRSLSSGQGPDEFRVEPTRPLELPDSSALPTPTPGGVNITDATPNADTIVALGGNPAAQSRGGVPSSDSALVARAGRYGVSSTIRTDLAQEDEAFRRRKARGGVFNLFGRDRYFRAYARQALDAYTELQRFRNLGVRTPTAPPQ
jgi:hypothetical protein